jgi:hypothetical protein
MNLKDILSISGEGTLFKFIAQGKNAVIVENLETGRRFSAGATVRVSALDEIAIFTTGEDLPLGKVMDKIWEKENGGETLSHKLPDAGLKEYFAEVLPDYDRDRVYTSDIKKVLHWYNILHKLNLLVKEEEKPEGEEAGSDSGEKSGGKEKAENAGTAVAKGKTKAKTEAKTDTKSETKAKAKAGSETGEKIRKAQAPKGSKAKPAEDR